MGRRAESSLIKRETRMAVVRFSVSLDRDLVAEFDRKIHAERCPTRSKAVGDLIRASLVQSEWKAGEEVAGAIVLVYDHHQRNLVRNLTEAQHECHRAIISTQHIHLSHDDCLEIIAVRGKAAEIETAFRRLRAVKGVKHISLAAGSTGERLP